MYNSKLFKVDGYVEMAKEVSKDELLAKHHEICDFLKDLRKRKGNDYGSVFEDTFADYGLLAPVVRFRDKMGRIENLLKTERMVNDESIRDTILDLGNYCILTVALIDCIEQQYKNNQTKCSNPEQSTKVAAPELNVTSR